MNVIKEVMVVTRATDEIQLYFAKEIILEIMGKGVLIP